MSNLERPYWHGRSPLWTLEQMEAEQQLQRATDKLAGRSYRIVEVDYGHHVDRKRVHFRLRIGEEYEHILECGCSIAFNQVGTPTAHVYPGCPKLLLYRYHVETKNEA